MAIPFNKPVYLGTELEAVRDAIEGHGHLAGGGPHGRACEESLRRLLGQETLLVSSCTHGLEMAGLLLGLRSGDEFIVPSFTFVSTANAFVLRGAKPVFADCDRNGNITPEEVESLRTAKTKAVVVVHYAGNPPDMDAVSNAAGPVPVIEDAAQALGSTYRGRPLGTFGPLGAISFHETKNVSSGEGGALTFRDASLLDRAYCIRDKGTNRKRFQDGLVDKYTWVDIGSSYVLSDLNAAYLHCQLDQFETIQSRRLALHANYERELGPLLARVGAYTLSHREGVAPNAHLFAIVFREGGQRSKFISYMKGHDIMTPFHYVSLHSSPAGSRFHDGRPLPMTERLATCLVRLPLFFNLSNSQQDEVIGRTKAFLSTLN